MNTITRRATFQVLGFLAVGVVAGCGGGGIEQGMPADTSKPSMPPEPEGPDIKSIAKQPAQKKS